MNKNLKTRLMSLGVAGVLGVTGGVVASNINNVSADTKPSVKIENSFDVLDRVRIGTDLCINGERHAYGREYTIKEPTCTEEGLTARICKRCNEALTKTLPKKVIIYNG